MSILDAAEAVTSCTLEAFRPSQASKAYVVGQRFLRRVVDNSNMRILEYIPSSTELRTAFFASSSECIHRPVCQGGYALECRAIPEPVPNGNVGLPLRQVN